MNCAASSWVTPCGSERDQNMCVACHTGFSACPSSACHRGTNYDSCVGANDRGSAFISSRVTLEFP